MLKLSFITTSTLQLNKLKKYWKSPTRGLLNLGLKGNMKYLGFNLAIDGAKTNAFKDD
jgi:hypothetical protein